MEAMEKQNAHSGHRARMKKRYLEYGIESLNDHEILELLLYYAIPRADTNPTAHKLLDMYGSLSAVFDAPQDALEQIEGMGESSAMLLKLIPDVCRTYYCEKSMNDYSGENKEKLYKVIMDKFIGRMSEMSIVMLLSAKMKILFCDVVGFGTIDSINVKLKNVIKLTLKYNAKFAIVAHNHPSGVALPTREDIDATYLIRDALASVEVKLLDHLIVSDNKFLSLFDYGIDDLY